MGKKSLSRESFCLLHLVMSLFINPLAFIVSHQTRRLLFVSQEKKKFVHCEYIECVCSRSAHFLALPLRSFGNSRGTLSVAFFIFAASATVVASPLATSFSRSATEGTTS